MEQIRIKEEENSDSEDNTRVLAKERGQLLSNSSASQLEVHEESSLQSVKKEIAFSGLPVKLYIRPLPQVDLTFPSPHEINIASNIEEEEVKKELLIPFDGLPKSLQIQPLPIELAEREYQEAAILNQAIIDLPPNVRREKNFSCALCAKKIGTRGGLKYHIKTHVLGRPFKCDICNRSYATKNDFQTHFKRHAGELFTCDFCSKSFRVKDYLMYHVSMSHLPKVYPCNDCKKTKYFPTMSGLKKHYALRRSMAIAKINSRFMCKLCNLKFATLRDYKKHCKKRELLRYTCSVCSKQFGCYTAYVKHMREEKKAGVCTVCGIYTDSIKSHKDKFHSKYTCRVCKVFVTNIYMDYKKHHDHCGTTTEVQALGFSCTICNQHFRHRLTLNKHLNQNHATLDCNLCSKRFYNKELLKVHGQFHTRKIGKVQFTCILCVPHKIFYGPILFDGHFHAHHGSKNKKYGMYTCVKCKKNRTDKITFTDHINQCFELRVPRSVYI